MTEKVLRQFEYQVLIWNSSYKREISFSTMPQWADYKLNTTAEKINKTTQAHFEIEQPERKEKYSHNI